MRRRFTPGRAAAARMAPNGDEAVAAAYTVSCSHASTGVHAVASSPSAAAAMVAMCRLMVRWMEGGWLDGGWLVKRADGLDGRRVRRRLEAHGFDCST